jgi:anti-sigma regulatory factor (Ser/Thr protein kinase)
MLRREIVLGADTAGPRLARAEVGRALATWGDRGSREVVVLLVSELVTNAVVHARTPVTVRLEVVGRCATVEVDDASPAAPAIRVPRDNVPGGRGLQLLETLADRWGVRPREVGKTVWFELEAAREG